MGRLMLVAGLAFALIAGCLLFLGRGRAGNSSLPAPSGAKAQALAHAARAGGYGVAPQEAAAEYRKAHELDPSNRRIQGLFAHSLHQAGDDVEAVRQWRDLARQDDDQGRRAKEWLSKVRLK